MKLPTEQQSVDWALAEAKLLPQSPNATRRHLLMLLRIIKSLEARVRELENPPKPHPIKDI
jgi:hypothetical protein